MTNTQGKEKNSRLLPPASGRILIADPFLHDFYFRRSVVLLSDHGDEGTFGLILNKPVEVRFNEVVKGFPKYNASLYLGGPIKTNNLYFIHTLGNQIEGSMRVVDGLYWGGDLGQIKDLMASKQLDDYSVRFFIGYSGWMEKQLERELEERSWVVTSATRQQLIHSDPVTLWRQMVLTLGSEYTLWANFPTDPMMN